MKYSVVFAQSGMSLVVAVGLAAEVIKQSADALIRQMMSSVADIAAAEAAEAPVDVTTTVVPPSFNSGVGVPLSSSFNGIMLSPF